MRQRLIFVPFLIGGTVLAIWLCSMLEAAPDRSQALAAWAQTIGSVVAIFVAVAIALHQAKAQHHSAAQLEQERLHRRWSSAKAIVDALFQQCLEVAPAFEHSGRFGNVAFVGRYEPTSFQEAIHRVSAIPLFELDNPDLVLAVVGLQDEARILAMWIEEGIKCTTSAGAFSDNAVAEIAKSTINRLHRHYAAILDVTKGKSVEARPQFWRHVAFEYRE